MKVRTISKLVALSSASAVLLGVANPAFAAASPQEAAPAHLVQPGQSIQAAIDAAKPGATIVLSKGMHRENLLVTKPITLDGQDGAVLAPGATIASNPCTNDPDGGPGFNVGVCVIGKLGPIPPGQDVPTVLGLIDNVTLRNIRITQFGGDVVALGTRNLRIEHVEADHGGDGIFTEDGRDTRLVHNYAHDNDGNGFNVRGSSGLSITHNVSARNYGSGLLLINSSFGVISHSSFVGNCAGMELIDSAEPGIAGYLTVTANDVRANNLFCPAEESPSTSGIGIGMLGTTHVRVERNTVTGNVAQSDPQSGDSAQFGGIGIALFDGQLAGGPPPTDNDIVRNHITDNVPLDVVTDGSGSGNRFSLNACNAANVAGICQ